ncbi:MAG: hypothetical protein ACLR2G_14195 [Phascolarctobacterium faecium]
MLAKYKDCFLYRSVQNAWDSLLYYLQAEITGDGRRSAAMLSIDNAGYNVTENFIKVLKLLK